VGQRVNLTDALTLISFRVDQQFMRVVGEDAMSVDEALVGVVSPEELLRISEAKEQAKIREFLDKRRREEEQERELRRVFLERNVDSDALLWVMKRVRLAAEHGEREIRVLKFPAAYCTDHGRAINNLEDGWPETLSGYARRAYDVYAAHFQPRGYRFRAQILTYTDDGLGKVGLYLSW
jgi:hypothetical protein